MAHDDLMDYGTYDTAENTYTEKVNSDQAKLFARRKLEEYMEMKKLRELTE